MLWPSTTTRNPSINNMETWMRVSSSIIYNSLKTHQQVWLSHKLTIFITGAKNSSPSKVQPTKHILIPMHMVLVMHSGHYYLCRVQIVFDWSLLMQSSLYMCGGWILFGWLLLTHASWWASNLNDQIAVSPT